MEPPSPEKTPPARPASRGPWLLLAALLAAAIGVGVLEWDPFEEPVTHADLKEALEARHGPADAPIPGTLNEYRVEWQPRYMRVTDSRGDWLWIALEEARATELVFGLGVHGVTIEQAPDGLRLQLDPSDASKTAMVPRDPTLARVVTPTGVEDRAVKGSPHEIARGIFSGAERRPLRELLEAVTQPR